MSDAATEFFGQAQEFEQSLGSMVGACVVNLVKADVLGRQASAGVIETLLVGPDGKPRPNVEVTDSFAFGSGKDAAATFRISEPVFLLTELSSFLPTTAKIAFSMNLNASANDSKSYKAQESASGTGSIGWGPFKVSVHVAATGAERGSSTRKSDQRTKADCEVQMARVNPPEGVNRLNDLLTDLGDLAKTIVKAQARDAAQAAAVAAGLTVGPPAPAPAPGG